MLIYLICWTLLLGCGAAVGSAMLALPKSSTFARFGDHLIAATWLGLLTIAAVLLGLSVLTPLTPWVGFGVMIVFGGAAACTRAVRRDFSTLLIHTSGPVAFAFGILAVVAALNATRFVEAYDTGLYHYPLTRWLSAYGTVRGLALIHFRFGFSSSWFALAAPFDFGVLQGRIAALLGGMAIFLCLSHFALALTRIWQRRGERADWFVVGGYAFILSICFSWAFEVSLSPDVPVWILTLLVGWLMLLSDRDENSSQTRVSLSPIVVLLVAVCTMSLKPSAAPIVAVAGLFYLFQSSSPWVARLGYAVLAGLIAVPVIAANLTSSGCPVYPNPAFCMDVPWGVGKAAARVITNDIGDWGRWRDVPTASGAMPSGSWIMSWISQPDKLVLISFCGVCLIGFVLARGWRGGRSVLWVLGLALFGTAFLLMNAPNPRFGIGYFALYPALLLAAIGPVLVNTVPGKLRSPRRESAALIYALVIIAALVGVHGAIREVRLERALANGSDLKMPEDSTPLHRLILPPALATAPGDIVITKNRKLSRVGRLELLSDRTNGIDYRSPKDRDQCWAAALPCVPTQLEGDVTLRLPADGIRSGFIHATKLGDASRR